MPRVRIVVFSHSFGLCEQLRTRLSARGMDVCVTEVPDIHLPKCSYKAMSRMQSMLTSGPDEISVFLPRESEYFLKQPDLTLMYSGYRSWHDPSRYVVMPHLWAPNMPGDAEIDSLRWTKKPPLSIGFAGNSYLNSRAARLGAILPRRLRELVISGRHLQYPGVVCCSNTSRLSLIYCASFVRIESLEVLSRSGLKQNVHLCDQQFGGKSDERLRYKQNMANNSYILCPRGMENFSFRFYEALAHGRVPILIDSNQVLPDVGVDWDSICVRVPYPRLGELEQIIRDDYSQKSEADFLTRQSLAFDSIRSLKNLDWMDILCDKIQRKATGKCVTSHQTVDPLLVS